MMLSTAQAAKSNDDLSGLAQRFVDAIRTDRSAHECLIAQVDRCSLVWGCGPGCLELCTVVLLGWRTVCWIRCQPARPRTG